MVDGFPGNRKERETGFEFGCAKNTLKGRWFLAPPVRSPTPDPTDSAVNMAYSASSSLHMNLLNSVSNCSRFGRYN